MPTSYDKLTSYEEKLKYWTSKKLGFFCTISNYTRIVDFPDGDRFIFNENGKPDGYLLNLVSMVRDDADDFEKNGSFLKRNKDPNPPKYFSLKSIPKGLIGDEVVGYKIDLSSAYWVAARNMGIVSDKTNQYFQNRWINYVEMGTKKPNTEAKKARLAALGSLASTKKFERYEDGEKLDILIEPKVYKHRDLYISVQRYVDDIMQKIMMQTKTVFYYYVDCFFVVKAEYGENVKDIARLISDEGMSASVDDAIFRITKTDNLLYIEDCISKKLYPIKNSELHKILLSDGK
jgi:hypothetical protein